MIQQLQLFLIVFTSIRIGPSEYRSNCFQIRSFLFLSRPPVSSCTMTCECTATWKSADIVIRLRGRALSFVKLRQIEKEPGDLRLHVIVGYLHTFQWYTHGVGAVVHGDQMVCLHHYVVFTGAHAHAHVNGHWISKTKHHEHTRTQHAAVIQIQSHVIKRKALKV